MKTTNTPFKKLSLFAVAFSVLAFTSACSDDNDIDQGESVNVKIVNAAEGSSAQDFYIEGSKINSSAVAFGESTSYITTPHSGNDKKIEFRTSGSADVYASEDQDLKENRNYTFFLYGTGNSAGIEEVEDDLSAPASGKAKVRFIHVASAGPEDVDIYNGDSKIAADVERGDVSSFTTVDAGLQLLNVRAAGGSTSLQEITFNQLSAGKIYTVLLYGSTDLMVKVIAHN